MQGRLPPGTGQDTRTTGSGERRALVSGALLPGLMACAPVAPLGAAALPQHAARRELQPRELRVRLVPLRRPLSERGKPDMETAELIEPDPQRRALVVAGGVTAGIALV